MVNGTYKTFSNWVLAVVSLYVVVVLLVANNTKFAETNGLNPGNWLAVFTGPQRLAITNNSMSFKIKGVVDSFSFEFSGYPSFSNEIHDPRQSEVPQYRLTVLDDNKTLEVKAKEPGGLKGTTVTIDPRMEVRDVAFPAIQYIAKVVVDGVERRPSTFFYRIMDPNSRNIEMFYAFHVKNISVWFAQTFGRHLVYSLQSILLILFICQLILFAVAAWQGPEVASKYYLDSESSSAVGIVDKVSKEYSVPLGLLGTVVSVWYSLESPDNSLGDFYEVLGVIKIAIFTTVLGVATKVVCALRGFHLELMRDIQGK